MWDLKGNELQFVYLLKINESWLELLSEYNCKWALKLLHFYSMFIIILAHRKKTFSEVSKNLLKKDSIFIEWNSDRKKKSKFSRSILESIIILVEIRILIDMIFEFVHFQKNCL